MDGKCWIITCNNTTDYDVDKAYLKYKRIDWKQGNKLNNCAVGDIAYIYLTAPYGYIKYKAKIVKVNKPTSTIDDSDCVINDENYANSNRFIEIEFLYRYENELVSYTQLVENGVGTVQGGTEIKDSTARLLESAEKKDREIQRFDGVIPNDLPANHWSLSSHSELGNDNNISENILFCSVTRMDHYKGVHRGDPAYGGGKHVDIYGTGFEVYNFLPVSINENNDYYLDKGTYCFGFAEAGHSTSGEPSRIHIENIVGCKELKDVDELSDCLIIFAAPKYSGQGYMIVGWYNHATIYRDIVNKRPGVEIDGAYYFVARTSDCVLLPPLERRRDNDKYWDFPVNVKGFSGRHHLWYADYTDSREYSEDIRIQIKNFRDQITSKISFYEGENFIYKSLEETNNLKFEKYDEEKKKKIKADYGRDEDAKMDYDFKSASLDEDGELYIPHPEEPEKNGVKRIDITSGYVRRVQRVKNALARANYCCEYDKEHPSFIRKSDNTQYTEAHHLVPFAEQYQFKYSIDVEANIVSLCSNCHNQIHFGRNPEIILEKLYNDRKEELLAAGIEIESFDELLHYYR